MKTITRIEAKLPLTAQRKRVAAYCRVSTETERLSHSLAAQTSFYSAFIRANPEWEYAGVYADSFISGTKASNRPELKRLLEDCEARRVDIILTKSISRFARNLVDLLKIVRRLKETGISVRFEKENIDTLTADGELMLSILAGFAEEESKSISANVRWAVRNRFKSGEQWHKPAFGYRWDKNKKTFVVEPAEAEIVRGIFADYLADVPVEQIARRVRDRGYPSFSRFRAAYILRNEVYKGDVELQKTFGIGPLTPRRKNQGELPRYYVSDNHEAIIAPEVWDAVQTRIRAARECAPDGSDRTVGHPGILSSRLTDGTDVSSEAETRKPNRQSVSDPHKPFPGYVWTKRGYMIVPAEAEMVRMVFRLYGEGNSIQSVCKAVSAAGYHSFRGKVSSRFVSRMLDDERYTGRRIAAARYSGTGREEIIPDDHEAIIAPDLFDAVHARRLAMREKYGPAGEKKAVPQAGEKGGTEWPGQ